MKIKEWTEGPARSLAKDLVDINLSGVLEHSISGFGMGQKVQLLLEDLKAALFPSLYEQRPQGPAQLTALVEARLQRASQTLNEIIMQVMSAQGGSGSGATSFCRDAAEEATAAFMNSLADLRRLLSEDLSAAYEGDPAAIHLEEILLSYPSMEAVTVYRLAHKLWELHIPIIPRIMTELAHQVTGIDIHPGATIGRHFFIDHGTGVVIGETCIIGDNVKLYQGVTLGAKSFELDEKGNPVKGVKRHPNIEDNVIIYAGATILGGGTTVGAGSVIGGNVWLTHSVPPGSKVYNSTPKPTILGQE